MDSEIIKPILAGMVRHGLTSMGAVLVADGAITQGEVSGFVGAGMIIAGAAWSWYQKVGQAKLIALMAKMKPVAIPSATVGEAVKAAKDAAERAQSK